MKVKKKKAKLLIHYTHTDIDDLADVLLVDVREKLIVVFSTKNAEYVVNTVLNVT